MTDFSVTDRLWQYGIGSRGETKRNAVGGFKEIAAAKAAERGAYAMRMTGAADALNDWKPQGPNPSQLRSDLQRNYNSVGAGRMAILVPESLQQKMDADPDYARQIMAKLQAWKENYDRRDNMLAAAYGYNVAEHQAGKSYVFDLDENGDVRNCTVTGCGRITVSSSEFAEESRARKEKRREYEKLAEENALKRKMLERKMMEWEGEKFIWGFMQ